LERDFHFFTGSSLGDSEKKQIKDFGQAARALRVVAINSKGNQLIDKRSGCLVVMASLGNFEGQIIFFSDVMTMPEQIRKLLMDPSILKVGSGMLCFMSGHDRSVQTDPESTQHELHQMFFMSQPEGLLTCLPLLCSSEQV
jgi:hypothetical protein